MRIFTFLILGFILVSLFSCDEKRVFEKNIDFKGNNWFIDSVASFSFKIKEPKDKNLLVNVRNSISYPFANLYIQYTLTNNVNKTLDRKLLRLPLFERKTGKPYGKGLGDIFDHRFTLIKNYNFPDTGTYHVQIKQYMRQDPLPFIMSVGLRVEEAK